MSCPVRWLVERMLRADDLDPDPEPLARGGLAHAALKDTLEGLRRETGSARLTPGTLGLARELLEKALEENEAAFPLSAAPERRPGVRRRLEADLERYLEHAAELDSPLEPKPPGAWVRVRGRARRVACRRSTSAGRDAARADRPRRRRRARRGGRVRLQGPQRAAGREVDRGGQPAGRAVHARRRGPARAAGGRGLLPAADGGDLRARGVLDGDSGVEIECVRGDVRERAEVRALLDEATAAAREAAAQAGRGELEARPETCAFKGRLHVPDDLPVRAVMKALTSEQEQAVARRHEPLLLAAGAGSGKTSVLVERFVRAVREDGVAPGRILAITFTERAAGELRERVRERLQELGEREAARDTEAAFVSTFHGFCARLLRAHPLMAGLDPEFAILDEGLAGRMRERAFSAALRGFLDARSEAGHRGEAVDLLAAYGADRVRSMVEGVYAELRSRGQRQPRLPEPALEEGPDAVDAAGAAACALLGELLEGFGRSYEALKRGRGAVDFDDLELCARELLEEHEGVRAAWSERFELLMVDEFQDTNPASSRS